MKKVFFSFHYELDFWRVNQVRNMGVVEGQQICKPNEWEEIKRKGDENIKKWINDNMKECNCVILLIGEKTHTRRWVRHEAKKARELKKPIFGIFIHNLKDQYGKTARRGQNVFDIYAYEPKNYDEIRENLSSWIDKQCDLLKYKNTLPTDRD
ncbi:TIR domain-containing protein [Campylobacter troglodytis]|uniref:TIR domain-containing protein n=1 Tax=Campylobacter troglodytis TaxID=654363 RepID=UPI00163B991D|nr:TIR domain-containing protein [Campylobacter troglodytis]